MGNQTSEDGQNQQRNFIKDYRVVRKVTDPRLGEITILENKEKKNLVGMKMLKANSEEEIEKYQSMFNSRTKLDHPNVAAPLMINFKREEAFCGSFHKISVLFEFHDHDLEQDVKLRQGSDSYYTEEELWYIAESIIQSMAYLSVNNVPYGYLTPKNVFVTDGGNTVYKIIVHGSFGHTESTYFQILSGKQSASYISPKLFQELKRKAINPKHDEGKSDVYAMGMTLLQAATLQNVRQFYDDKRYQINYELIENRLMMVSEKYSEEFGQFLREILSQKESERPDFLSLAQRLSANHSNDAQGSPNQESVQRLPEENQLVEEEFNSQNLLDTQPALEVEGSINSRLYPTQTTHQQQNNQSPKQQAQLPLSPVKANLNAQPLPQAQTENPVKGVKQFPVLNYGLQNIKQELKNNVQPQPQVNTYQTYQSQFTYPIRTFTQYNPYQFQSQYQKVQPNKENKLPQQQQRSLKYMYQNKEADVKTTEEVKPQNVEKELEKKASPVKESMVIPTPVKVNQSTVQTNPLVKPVVPTFQFDQTYKNNTYLTKIEEQKQTFIKKEEPETQKQSKVAGFSQYKKLDIPTYQSYYFNPQTLTTTTPINANFKPQVTTTVKPVQVPQANNTQASQWINDYKQKYGIKTLGTMPSQYLPKYSQFQPIQTPNYTPVDMTKFKPVEAPKVNNSIYTQQMIQDLLKPIKPFQMPVVQKQQPLEQFKTQEQEQKQKPEEVKQETNQIVNTTTNLQQQPQTFDYTKYMQNNTFNTYKQPQLAVNPVQPVVLPVQTQLPEVVQVQQPQPELPQVEALQELEVEQVPEQKQEVYNNDIVNKYLPQQQQSQDKTNLAQHLQQEQEDVSQYEQEVERQSENQQQIQQQSPQMEQQQNFQEMNQEPVQVQTSLPNMDQYQQSMFQAPQLQNQYQTYQPAVQQQNQMYQVPEQLQQYQAPEQQYEAPEQLYQAPDQYQVPEQQSPEQYEDQQSPEQEQVEQEQSPEQNYQQEEQLEQENYQEQQFEQSPEGEKERVEEEYQDGSIYYGEKSNGLRHGYGKFAYADGGVYEGEWRFGTMDGYGKLYYPSEKLAYEGEWKRNAFNGNGKVYNEEPSDFSGEFDFQNFDELEDHWDRFEGEFVEDFKEGLGTLYLVNDEKYVGEFKQDMVNGKGVFYRNNGEVVQGEWVCNKQVQ